MTVKFLDQLELEGKRVLVRVDYNVPLDGNGRISDDSRVRASLPTLQALLERRCQITLMSHLGRPDGAPDPAYSTRPLAACLCELLARPVNFVESIDDVSGPGEIRILENLRFDPGETKNDEAYARKLARHGEVYINDAFGAAHRAHASIAAICQLFKHKGAGLLMMKELHYLQDALRIPQRPFLAILGGSKISDKLKLIKNLVGRVDGLVIGGGMSYSFLKAKGVEVGNSLVEESFLEDARQLMADCQSRNITLSLPLDHVTGEAFKEDAQAAITLDQEIEPGTMGLDIGPETIHHYSALVRDAKTVVWNGPMGVFEWDAFATGTISIAEAMAETEALTIVGGGDSVAAINAAGVAADISHISTGGGASLELLGGQSLPGVVALES